MDDDKKLATIKAMRTLHRHCGHWLTVTSIATAMNMSAPYAKQMVRELIADGWLNVRDPDKKSQWLLVQLKPEYRR